MGSELHVVLVGGSDADHEAAAAQVAHLEQAWSRFLPGSDISRINAAQGAPVQVRSETIVLLAAMTDAAAMTDGAFDPTVLPELVALGYGASRHDPSACSVLPPLGTVTGTLEDLVLDVEHGFVILPAGLTLDAGGIGKGLAADLVVEALLARGVAGALVSIGGDLAMAGTPPSGEGWTISIDDPRASGRVLGTFAMDGGGVATSSTVSRRWSTAAGERHHLIAPSTGMSSDTDLLTATVIAPTGWQAEAHATAALLAGSRGVIAHLERCRLSGLAVAADGTVLTTPDLAEVALSIGVSS